MFLLLLIFLHTGKCHPVLMFKNHLNIHKHYIYMFIFINIKRNQLLKAISLYSQIENN